MQAEIRKKPVTRILESVRTLEGAGFAVRRPFPTRELDAVDPFLLLDEMGPMDLAPGEAKGAPDHPHRGFETVTYVLAGRMEHRDSSGHAGSIGPGDVQWMTAGAGVVHSEMPARDILEHGGRMHGFQLWVNLPRRDKRVEPRYQEFPAARIPTYRSADGGLYIRIIAGETNGRRSPVETHTPIHCLHCRLAPGAAFEHEVPAGWTACAYVFAGAGRFGSRGQAAESGHLVLFGEDGTGVAFECAADATEPMEALLLAGAPIGEPVARHGPFVMNTGSEIIEAIQDYRAGRMGRIAPPPRPPTGGAPGIVGLALLAALSGSGCAGSSETRTDVDTQEYSTSVTIVGSRAESQLIRGREAIAAGRYKDGIAIFEEVHAMPSAKPEHREQALLALGQAHSNILNPARDPSKALGCFRQLLAEFPETKQRYEVERAIAELEKSPKQD